MADKCLAMAGGTIMRVTQVDPDCGVVGSLYAVSKCIATVEVTHEYIEPTDLTPLNMDGQACWVYETDPQLKWERLNITMNKVNLWMWNFLTGSPLYLNEAAPTPEVVGATFTRGQTRFASAGLELWLPNPASGVCAPGEKPYNYFVASWITRGRIGDFSVGNNVVNFNVTGARSGVPSPWGVGPYNVERNAVTGVPRPMLTPIPTTLGDEGIARPLVTTLAPPPETGCMALSTTPVFAVLPLAGAAPLAVVGTFPTDAITGLPILPARIDWDDGTPVQVVTSGTTAGHNYAIAGSYNAVFTPTGYSSPNYTSAAVVVS